MNHTSLVQNQKSDSIRIRRGKKEDETRKESKSEFYDSEEEMNERKNDLLTKMKYTGFTIHQHPLQWALASGIIRGDSLSAQKHKIKVLRLKIKD